MASLTLTKFESALTLLDSDKVTVRKKAKEEFESLLGNRQILVSLNKGSSARGLTWDYVYDKVQTFIEREADKMIKDLAENKLKNLSATITLSVGSAAQLWKHVIRRANQGDTRLSCQRLLTSLLGILDSRGNSFIRTHFGAEAVKILHRSVLNNPHYLQRITVQDAREGGEGQWIRLLKISFQLFQSKKPPHGLDPLLLCSFLHDLLVQCDAHTSLPRSLLLNKFPFFTNLIGSTEINSSSTDTQKQLLKTIVTFMRLVTPDCRIQVCELGNNVMPHVIEMYEDRTHAEVINFVHLQMQLHHPGGARTAEEGAYLSGNEEVWRKNLNLIYSNLIDTVISNTIRRTTKSTSRQGSKTVTLSHELVQLAVEVCFQIYSLKLPGGSVSNGGGAAVTNITQIVPLDVTQLQAPAGPAPKRRRVEISFESLVDKVRKAGSSERQDQQESHPWLQILNGILKKYPEILPAEDVPSVVKALTVALQTCKIGAVRGLLLQCCSSILAGCNEANRIPEFQILRLWELAINSVSSNQCISESHQLTRILILSGRIQTNSLSQVYSLFVKKIVKCNVETIRTLLALISRCPVPKKPAAFENSGGILSSCNTNSIRLSLLKWLHDDEDEDSDQQNVENWNELKRLYPDEIAKLLCAITLKKCPRSFAINDEPLSKNLDPNEIFILETNIIKMPDKSLITPLKIEDAKFALPSVQDCLILEVKNHLQSSILQDCGFTLVRLNQAESDKTRKPLAIVDEGFVQLQLLLKIKESLLTLGMQEGNAFIDKLSSTILKLFTSSMEYLGTMMKSLNQSSDVQEAFKRLRQVVESSKGLGDILKTEQNFPVDLANKSIGYVARLEGQILNSTSSKKSNDGRNGDSVAMEIDEDSDEGDFFESTQRSRRPSMEMSKEDDDDETNYESTKLSPVTSVYLGLASLIALENAPDFFQAIQEKILKSLETTFRNNVNSEPCSMLSLVFEFFKILTEPSEISPSLAAGLIKLLMRVPKQFLRPANFHVEAAHGLLDALYHLARHVHVSGADGEKKNFLVFVQAMIQMQSQSGYERFSIDLQSKIVSLIVRLIELDQNVEWAVWKGKMHNLTANSDRKFMVDDDQEMLPIGRCLYRFVCHGSHKIRSFAAVGIQRLISNAGGITMNVRLKRAELVHLIEVFDHLTNKDEVLDHCGTSEENSNRISTIMTTLGPLAVNCRSLEVEVITGILIFYKNINVPIQTLKKIFNIIANENFSEASKETVNKVEVYLTSKIGYIMNEFLKQGNEVTKFPYQLLNCPNPKRFLLKFESILIPLCTWRTLSHALNFIGNILEKSPKDLVVHNFSMIVAYYIPISAMTNKEKKEEIVRSLGTNSDKVMKKVKKLHDLVYDILGEQRFGELLSENIAQVLAQVFKKLYDPKVLEVRFELKSALPLPNPPYTTEVLALNLIPYFTQYIDEGATLFSFLTKVKSDCLQIIAHELCSVLRVSAGARDLKIRALHGIDLFMRCLEKEVENLTEDLPYLIWFFVHSMLTLWKNVAIANDSDLLTCACVTITTILTIGMEHKISGTEKLFSPIKAVLVRQISRNRKYQDIVSLIVDYCCQNNPGIISQMGPFPDLPELQNINEVITALNLPKPKLSDVLKTFTFQEQDGPEDLANLCKALKAGKKDLNDMLNNLKNSKGRSEDAETSVLHSLICKLIDLTGYCKSNPEIAKSAAKCLGELGPLQLATAVLKPSSVVKVSVGEDPLVCFLPQMVKLFLKSLNHADNQHVDGATRALKSLLSFSGLKRMNLKSFFGTETFALVFPFIDAIKCDKNELDCEAFSQLVDDEDLWTRGSCHREWVVRIVTALLKSFTKGSAFRSCADICKVSPECCEQILPFIVHVILHSNWEKCRPILSQHFGNFFHSHFEKVRQDNASMDLSPSDSSTPGPRNLSFCNLPSVRVLLSVVNHLREQDLPAVALIHSTSSLRGDNWKKNYWLENLNYLHVARAALSTSAFYSAVMFVDIWCQTTRQNSSDQTLDSLASANASASIVDLLYAQDPGPGVKCQEILYEAYQHLGDVDALYGCGNSNLLVEHQRINHIIQEQKYFKAMSLIDIELVKGNFRHIKDLMATFSRSGLYHTLSGTLGHLSSDLVNDSAQGSSEQLLEYQYQCAWRLQQWDTLDATTEKNDSNFLFERERFFALKGLVFSEKDTFQKHISNARLAICDRLSQGIKENASVIYEDLGSLRAVCELEEFSSHPDKLEFSEYDLLPQADFEFNEPTRLQRCIAFEALAKKHAAFLEPSIESSFSYIRECCQERKFQLAHRRLAYLKGLANTSATKSLGAQKLNTMTNKVLLEEAKVFWASNEQKIAKCQLVELLAKLEAEQRDRSDGQTLLQIAECQQTLGSWYSELKTENANTILETYLKPAVLTYERTYDTSSKIIEAYVSLGKFCDAQYQQIDAYMKSKDFEEKQELIVKLRENTAAISSLNTKSKAVSVGNHIAMKSASLDKQEIENNTAERSKYLGLALENYGKALAKDHNHNLLVYRFVSLWLLNASNEEVNSLVDRHAKTISSNKFVDLLYQLAARLTDKNDPGNTFPRVLANLVMRCAKDHPFHTLPVLLALVNANADQEEEKALSATGGDGSATGRRRASTSSSENSLSSPTGGSTEDRSKMAKRIIDNIKKKPALSIIASDMERVCGALIKLAYAPAPSKFPSSGKVSLERSSPILKLKNVNIPILTTNIRVQANNDYDADSASGGWIGLAEYDTAYYMVGGINAPKKINCRGTDGIMRSQLVKGRDDLRQDAVMQQVFGLMNTLLKNDEETGKKRLRIRQYKVVPLSQRSGVLEWCENTMPIGEFLIGSNSKGGAHAFYHPSDLKAFDCRKELTIAQKSGGNVTKEFERICAKFRPSMRYFFYQYFSSPGTHFERRLAYTRSVATNSMVGYILGLGDRHVQNILIDKTTAELIHIDLGVAFEQGRILATPETIPFRLTRDIVDGFGPTGVEGTFRRGCESTMHVLREHREDIMTILEVLVHDPLYNWSMTPEKAFRIQHGREPDEKTKRKWAQQRQDEGGNVKNNKMAERVLLRVVQKLNGMEGGHHLSIEGQVNTLIQQARDPDRLSRVFPGWQPYI